MTLANLALPFLAELAGVGALVIVNAILLPVPPDGPATARARGANRV